MATFLSNILFILTLLLIGIIMLQRGRGGGLAGALGGMGGQSAFGTRAGDVFTRITAYMALGWVALACLTGGLMRSESERFADRPDEAGAAVSAAADDKSKDDTKSESTSDETKSVDESKSEKPDTSSKSDSSSEKAAPAKTEGSGDKPEAKKSDPAPDKSEKKSE